jgi:hypothetical protein
MEATVRLEHLHTDDFERVARMPVLIETLFTYTYTLFNVF